MHETYSLHTRARRSRHLVPGPGGRERLAPNPHLISSTVLPAVEGTGQGTRGMDFRFRCMSSNKRSTHEPLLKSQNTMSILRTSSYGIPHDKAIKRGKPGKHDKLGIKTKQLHALSCQEILDTHLCLSSGVGITGR